MFELFEFVDEKLGHDALSSSRISGDPQDGHIFIVPPVFKPFVVPEPLTSALVRTPNVRIVREIVHGELLLMVLGVSPWIWNSPTNQRLGYSLVESEPRA